MTWPAKYIQPPVTEGVVRVMRVFAWLPKQISDKIVWFTHYEVLQVYRITEQKVEIDGEKVTFTPGNWINITKRCI